MALNKFICRNNINVTTNADEPRLRQGRSESRIDKHGAGKRRTGDRRRVGRRAARGFLLKKRIGIDARGKSSGLRTILAYRHGSRVVFLYVFGKSERDNISTTEQQALSELGAWYMGLTTDRINSLIASNTLQEIR
jgi:hypothetical protein